MPIPRPLTPDEVRRTLVGRFEGTQGQPGLADRLRQLHTKFGARSRRVFLVWTTATGEERGEGTETELARREILPTPLIVDLTAVALNPYSAGKFPVGSIRVGEVSAALHRDDLVGRAVPGHQQPISELPNVDFFYEVVEDGRGDNPAPRMRFRLAAEPSRDETNVCWTLVLERATADRTRSGASQLGGGD